MNSLNRVSGYCAVEPLPKQLLGTLKPSLAALRLLPAGEGTSNCLGSDSSSNNVDWKITAGMPVTKATQKQLPSEAPSDVLSKLEVVL